MIILEEIFKWHLEAFASELFTLRNKGFKSIGIEGSMKNLQSPWNLFNCTKDYLYWRKVL